MYLSLSGVQGPQPGLLSPLESPLGILKQAGKQRWQEREFQGEFNTISKHLL